MIGLLKIGIIGLGTFLDSSEILVPFPPLKYFTFHIYFSNYKEFWDHQNSFLLFPICHVEYLSNLLKWLNYYRLNKNHSKSKEES